MGSLVLGSPLNQLSTSRPAGRSFANNHKAVVAGKWRNLGVPLTSPIKRLPNVFEGAA